MQKFLQGTAPLKFMLSKKATKIDEIFTVNLTLTTCKIDVEDFVNFCGFLRKYELYRFTLNLFGLQSMDAVTITI